MAETAPGKPEALTDRYVRPAGPAGKRITTNRQGGAGSLAFRVHPSLHGRGRERGQGQVNHLKHSGKVCRVKSTVAAGAQSLPTSAVESGPHTKHMNMKKILVGGNSDGIAMDLLRANAQLLFLPFGCPGIEDSNYESYLDCFVPESAICLSGGRKGQVAIGDGFHRLALLESNGPLLRLARSLRNGIPIEVEQVLQNLFENLGGHPSRRCVMEFVQWVYTARPTSLVVVLEYFLANPDSWLIGLPGYTSSKCFVSEPPIKSDFECNYQWYGLCALGLTPNPQLARERALVCREPNSHPLCAKLFSEARSRTASLPSGAFIALRYRA
jgi:hypothetical protein